jgi:hypothetical protein
MVRMFDPKQQRHVDLYRCPECDALIWVIEKPARQRRVSARPAPGRPATTRFREAATEPASGRLVPITDPQASAAREIALPPEGRIGREFISP